MVRTETARDGNPLLVYSGPEGEFALSSRYQPGTEADRILADHRDSPSPLVIVIGAGNPALIIKAREIFSQALLLIIERETEILEAAVSCPDFPEDCITCDEQNYREVLNELLGRRRYPRLTILLNRTEARIWPSFVEQVRTSITEAHDRKSINVATISRFEQLWVRNIYRNTAAIISAAPISLLQGAGTGINTILIAAGPSLAADLPLLRKCSGNFLIIAVDTVYKALLRHGIRPDIVVVVDPQKINSRYVEHIHLSEMDKTLFVFEPAICPAALQGKSGKCLTFNTIFPYFDLLARHFGNKGELDMGGSVTTSVFEVARLLNCSTNLFLGLDLCISNDTYHVPGTMYEEYWFSEVSRLRSFEMLTYRLLNYEQLSPAAAADGRRVYMDAKFTMFRNWFQKKLADPALQGRFFNASGGIPIHGMEQISLASYRKKHAVDPQHKHKLTQSIRSSVQSFTPLQGTSQQEFLRTLTEINSHLRRYRETCTRAERTAQAAQRRISLRQDADEQLRQLAALDGELSRPFPGKDLVNIACQGIIHRITDGEEGRSREESLALSQELYRAIIDASVLNERLIANVPRYLTICQGGG